MRKFFRFQDFGMFAVTALLALAGIDGSASAADLPVKSPLFAKAPIANWPDQWTFWVEGGAVKTDGDPIYFEADQPIPQKWGFDVAAGVDYRFAGSPWHVSGQIRYGRTRESGNYVVPDESDEGTPLVGGPGTFTHRESRLVGDIALGRDINIGLGQTQMKFGLRAVDLKATSLTSSNVGQACNEDTCDVASVSIDQRSRFVGAGPRVAIEGSMPFAGSWAFDYGLGVAALFGRRSLNFTETTVFGGGNVGVTDVESLVDHQRFFLSTIANLDASAGLSYWFTPNAKLTAGYRFDGYWNAFRTFDSTADVTVSANRFYSGPFARFTMKFNGNDSAPAPV